jgi:AMP phosphorylase
MRLKIKKLRFLTGRAICIIHEKTAEHMSIHPGERISIKNSKGKKIVAVADIGSDFVNQHEIAISNTISENLNLTKESHVEVELTEQPTSIELIKKKLRGEKLKKEEIREIIENITNNSLSEPEVAFFVAAVHLNGMTLEETKNLTQAMVEFGNQIKLNGKVVDKHSIGGVAGNRTTPIVTSICAAAGLKMPKTSSRAITSAAGTADVIELVARVNFPIEEIKKIIKKTNACLVWGGALGLAPSDDKIIKIEKIVNIDSTAQLLASILSKKIAVGSKYVLIDIPYGKSAKVTEKEGKELREKFLELGSKFDLKLDVVLTNGSEPIGRGIGPLWEMKDILKVLKRIDPPADLETKAIFLAGKLLELSDKARKGKGEKLAKEILDSGKAFSKFEEIIKAQHGSLYLIKDPKYSYDVLSKKKMHISHISNKFMSSLGRFAGCPEDKLAGIYLHKKKGNLVKKGEKILTIYAMSEEKLEHAKKFYFKHWKEGIEHR